MARKKTDPKAEALRESRTLNPRPEAVTDEASLRLGLLRPARPGAGEVRDGAPGQGGWREREPAAAAFGLSRQSWYQAAAALDEGGLPGLLPGKPGPRGAHKLTGEVVEYLRALAASDPALRPAGLAEAAEQRFGIQVHPRSVERALTRPQEPDRSPKSS